MRWNRKSLEIITAPVNAVVSTADMKTYLRVDTSDDDALIDDFIDAATQQARNYLNRSLITETLELTMDGFTENNDSDERLARLGAGVHNVSYPYIIGHNNSVDLPFAPIQSVTSVKTFDRDNTESTFSAANYELDEQGGRLYLNEGETWPDNLRAREAVKIRYVSGYGDDATDIPSPIVQSIKMMVAQMYECRGVCDMPASCKNMLNQYKLYDFMAAV